MDDGVQAAIGDVAVEDQLVYQGAVFINFVNNTYEWVDIKLFALPPGDLEDRRLLELLTRHVRYRNSYAGTGDKDMEIIHGPYWLQAITTESFTRVDAADAEALLRTWSQYYAPLPETVRSQMETELYARLHAATSIYQLADLRAAAEHDWGQFVGKAGFHEFVLIDRSAQSLALVVASDD